MFRVIKMTSSQSSLYLDKKTSCSESESLDEEVKELLNHYKHKRATTYEPCNRENFRECLIGVSEELSLLNISYIFNPYVDVERGSLIQDALVKLINTVWTLLHHHKNMVEKVDRLTEQNHSLEQNNKQLNIMVSRLKDLSNIEKNEARACVASAQRISDRSDEIYKKLIETQAKLTQITKQKETNEKSLHNQIVKLKLENEKLTERLRNKSGSFSPCSDVCDSTLLQLKERERKQRAVIAQLQTNNQNLLREILAMKEELILGGLHDLHFDKGKK